jgi:hypothetical protein
VAQRWLVDARSHVAKFENFLDRETRVLGKSTISNKRAKINHPGN